MRLWLILALCTSAGCLRAGFLPSGTDAAIADMSGDSTADAGIDLKPDAVGAFDLNSADASPDGPLLKNALVLADSTQFATIQAVARVGSDDYVIAGQFIQEVTLDQTYLGSNNDAIFVARLNGDGAYVWAFTVNSPTGDAVTSITVDNNTAYVAGHLGGDADFGGVQVNGLIPGGPYAFVAAVALDNGAGQWVVHDNAGFFSIATDVVVGANGDPIVVGSFAQSAEFGAMSVNNPLAAIDGYLLRVSPGGTPVKLTHVGSPSVAACERLANRGQATYVIGSFSDAGDFGSGAQINAVSNSDIFVSEIGATGFTPVLRAQASSAVSINDAQFLNTTSLVIAGEFSTDVTFEQQLTTIDVATDGFVATADINIPGWRWSAAITGVNAQQPQAVISNDPGGVRVIGFYEMGAQVDGFVSLGPRQMFIADWDINGTFLNLTDTGGAGLDSPRDAIEDGKSFVIVGVTEPPSSLFGKQAVGSPGSAVGFLLRRATNQPLP